MAALPEIFKQKLLVKANHLDEQEHVNNVQWVQWVQDVAKAHWESLAPKEISNKVYWVVVQHEINYKRPAFLNDELQLQTYVEETTHVTSVRYVIIKNAESGKVLVEAKTTWCLMDKARQKPAKINEYLKKLFQKESSSEEEN